MPGHSMINVHRCKNGNGEYQYEAFIKSKKIADIYYANGKDSSSGFRVKIFRTDEEFFMETMLKTKIELAKKFGVWERG